VAVLAVTFPLQIPGTAWLLRGRSVDTVSIPHRFPLSRIALGHPMVPPNLIVPGLLSVPRITTLLASLLVAVGSGTNYVRFQAWRSFSLSLNGFPSTGLLW
jgi:hypothetical protein